MLYLGTHNSCTGGKLVWWQWLFTPIFQLFSKCQDRSLKDQLEMGVKLFNFQITFYNNEWHFSHGLCTYREKLEDAINLMYEYSTVEDPIYFQLYLDKNFFLGQKKDLFRELINTKLKFICAPNKPVILLNAWIEGTNEYPYKSNVKINIREHYWTMNWAKNNSKSWVDKLPLPKRHARIYNQDYKNKYKDSNIILMLDFFEL